MLKFYLINGVRDIGKITISYSSFMVLRRRENNYRASCKEIFSMLFKWCGSRDLNSHILRYWNLNPARLPIPPNPQGLNIYKKYF
jgi:hypothetical protein